MKNEGSKESYAFTDRCIGLMENLVLQVVSTNKIGNFIYGVTACNPSALAAELLTADPGDLLNRQECWVVREDAHCYSGEDCIVYSVSSEGQVKVSKNNVFETATFFVDPSQPLWFFYNVSGNISELKIMGTFVSDETHTEAPDLEQRVIDEGLLKEEPSNEASGTSGEQEHTKCAICAEASVNNAVYTCRHLCLCCDCAVNVMKEESNVPGCPICGEPIKDVFEVFY